MIDLELRTREKLDIIVRVIWYNLIRCSFACT